MGKHFIFGSGAGNRVNYVKEDDSTPDSDTVERDPELRPVSGFKLRGGDKDKLHKERLELEQKISEGILSADQMRKGESEFLNHDEQVRYYDRWQKENAMRMERWHKINREFKKAEEEGRIHTMDDIRDMAHRKRKVKYY